MALDGRVEWSGPDPDVIQLTDNGKRKVRLRLAERGFELTVDLRDVDGFIRALEGARIWVREG